MFPPMNKALKNEPACIGLSKDSEVQAALLDLAVLVGDLGNRATHAKELVPCIDHYVGYCDAWDTVAGGIWMSGNVGLRPIVCRIGQKASWVSNQFGSRTSCRTTTIHDPHPASGLAVYSGRRFLGQHAHHGVVQAHG
jgi:hypothetical protein